MTTTSHRRSWDDEAQKEDKVICDEYLDLFEKSQQLFSGLRDLPNFGNQWQPYFQKAFEVYTKLWAFQQTYRNVLENKELYGLKRWEIGEIASKIGQLYYHFYLRTSETVYLRESFVFYEAIRNRQYFKDIMETRSPVMVVKKLRYYARFIAVALLLNQRPLVKELVDELGKLVEEYYETFKPSDIQEWHLVMQEINQFLMADLPVKFLEDKPIRSSVSAAAPSSLLSFRIKRSTPSLEGKVKLQEAILVGNFTLQVKFSELTLDMFRMIESLEYEFSPDDELNIKESIDSDRHRKTKNPRKYLLYRPTVSQILLFISAAFKDLQDKNILLLYIATDGYKSVAASSDSASKGKIGSHGGLAMSSRKTDLSTTSEINQNCFYPEDLIPFSRKPLFLIIDSDNSSCFKSFSSGFGSLFVCLLSPQVALVERKGQQGSLFTSFLHSPIMAFCQAVQQSKISLEQYNKANDLFTSFLSNLRNILSGMETLDTNYHLVIDDDILFNLIAKFIFCSTFFIAFKATTSRRECHPTSNPQLPVGLSEAVQVVYQIADVFQVGDQFVEKGSLNSK